MPYYRTYAVIQKRIAFGGTHYPDKENAITLTKAQAKAMFPEHEVVEVDAIEIKQMPSDSMK